MASVNSAVDDNFIRQLYVGEEKSIPQISDETAIPRSRIRNLLLKMGVLRSRAEAIRIAAAGGRLGSGMRGKTREFSDEWRMNIAIAAQTRADKTAVGLSLKPSGYIEHTRGRDKGRREHVTRLEAVIGRRLAVDEVVHHKDHNRQNNAIENLQLMTRSAHARLHAIENASLRKRAKNGKFE